MMNAQQDLPWRGIFRDLPREHGFEPLRVEGRLPDDLNGALYRCGPARFSIGGEPYLHWFDADGAVTAVRVNGGRAEGAVRTVDTRWLRKERAANQQLYRSYAQLGKGWRRWLTLPKNPANISVMPLNGDVLALWEAGLPIALDPATLATRGETDLGGRIGPTFSAHPHRAGGTLFNFGVRYGAKFSIDLYSFDKQYPKRIGSVPLQRPTIVHDFIATPRHLIFFCPPVRLRLARLLGGMGSFDSNLVWEPEHGTEIIVVPIASPHDAVRFTVPPFFQWHFINAWEERGAIVVDYIPYDDFETNAWFGRAPYDPPRPSPPSRYARARLDLTTKQMSVEVLSDVSSDFPAIHAKDAGNEHDHTWLLRYDETAGLPPTLTRFEAKTRKWRDVPLGSHSVPSEAVVVPQGWVLSLVYDGGRDASYVAVIDGARPEDGPVARLWFDHAIPFPFHGAWAV
jgi:all-trans-8'-apo-beta-carotenal 15,15'-oxygenase